MSVAADTGPTATGPVSRSESLNRQPREKRWLPARLGVVFCIVTAIGMLTALGVWQLERRTWKLALIARTEHRVHAAPVAAPGPAAWPNVTAKNDEYLRVGMTGRFLKDRETDVQAVTELGAGFWVLSPLQTDQGFTVLVNRGFVPAERRDPDSRGSVLPTAETTVTGLLRISEPKGGFLRSNDPAQDRWHSRDVAAIAAARGLSGVAPYFIDAEAGSDPDAWPRGGLTVIAFPNNHLVYALTWFGLALMLSGATMFTWRQEWRTWWMIWIGRPKTNPGEPNPISGQPAGLPGPMR